MKARQLQKGLRQLGEEGAVQVFEPLVDTNPLIGAVGQLQFELVEHRLKSKYGGDAVFERAGIHTARWGLAPMQRISTSSSKPTRAVWRKTWTATTPTSPTPA